MVEKLLTNWLSICLHTFLQVSAAGPEPKDTLLHSHHMGITSHPCPL